MGTDIIDGSDDLDTGIADVARLEPRDDRQPAEGEPDAATEAARAASDAGDSTPPASQNEQDGADAGWVGDPALAELAAKKGWTSPADALKAYQGLEEIYGRQNTERDEERRLFEQQRQELIDAVKAQAQNGVQPTAQPQLEEPPADLADQIDWEDFGERFDMDPRPLEVFARGILPLFQKQAEDRVRAEMQQQLAPIQGFTEEQQRYAAFDAEMQAVSAEDPELWEATAQGTFEILQQWDQQGVPLDPGHIRLAQADAVKQLYKQTVNGGGEPPAQPDATPAQQPVVQQQAAPAQQQPVGPGVADLQPLSSTTVAQETADPNEAWRKLIDDAEPTPDANDF